MYTLLKFTSPLLKIMCHKDFVDVFLVETLLKLLIGNLTYAHQHYLKPVCKRLLFPLLQRKQGKYEWSPLCAGYIIFKHLEEGINSIIHREENHSKGLQL